MKQKLIPRQRLWREWNVPRLPCSKTHNPVFEDWECYWITQDYPDIFSHLKFLQYKIEECPRTDL